MAQPTPDDLNICLQVGRLRGDLSLKHIGSRKIQTRVFKLPMKRAQSDRVITDTLVYLPGAPLQIEAKET